MAENKTRATKASVAAFLNGLDDAEKRKDSAALVKLMARITGGKSVMWSPSIAGIVKLDGNRLAVLHMRAIGTWLKRVQARNAAHQIGSAVLV
jgi:hypothetical protein